MTGLPAERLRDEMAAAICPGIHCESHSECLDDANALMPLADDYGRERAAEALREAADEAQRLGLLPGNVHGFFTARADRIEAGSSRGAATTTS